MRSGAAWSLPLSRPANLHRDIDPAAVGVLHAVVRVLVRLGVDHDRKAGILQTLLERFDVVGLEADVIDAFGLVVALDLDQGYVDVAVGHVDRAAAPALRLEAENLLVKFHHLGTVSRHHRDVPDFGPHDRLLYISNPYSFAAFSHSIWRFSSSGTLPSAGVRRSGASGRSRAETASTREYSSILDSAARARSRGRTSK